MVLMSASTLREGKLMRIALAAALVIVIGSASTAHPNDPRPTTVASNSVAPSARPAAASVDAFHSALRRGDTRAALSFLAEDALIFESGGAERSKAEYAAHHLGADAAFSQAVPSRMTRRRGAAAGTIAWIASEGRTTGTYKGKQVDVVTTETMVLRRTGGGWKIVHIHWSSAAGGK
jgi:ketosteroid isomerase-like protein